MSNTNAPHKPHTRRTFLRDASVVVGALSLPSVGWARPAESDAEVGMEWMREEEKLARDVYLNNHDRYGLRIFKNISAAEQRHMDGVLRLLNARDVDDPAAGTGRNVFKHPKLARLFEELNDRSARSLTDALRVGAEVEEIDLLDLDKQLATASAADARQVYSHLARGTRNHLRAFVRQLSKRDVVYQPVHLSQERFDAILAEGQERGRGRGRGRERRRRGQGGGSRGRGRGLKQGGCDDD